MESPIHLAVHLRQWYWPDALSGCKPHLTCISFVLAVAWLCHELRSVRLDGIADHLPMKHGTFAARDTLPWSIHLANLSVLLVFAITHLRRPTMFVMMVSMMFMISMHKLFHLILEEVKLALHGRWKGPMVMGMMAATTRPQSITISLANALYMRTAICNRIQSLACIND